MEYQIIILPCCTNPVWPKPGEPEVVIRGLLNNDMVLDTTDSIPTSVLQPFLRELKTYSLRIGSEST